ncbi:DUF3857 and transglutaminase domain-containing protein [Seonamhaeicola sp. MEBiC1930]|uniref:DUF3857 domain-containing protein n=1 Tax=Seonamhaeicola sp. MEBiC01930 TaxID=2976768 RepID=UPI003249FACC
MILKYIVSIFLVFTTSLIFSQNNLYSSLTIPENLSKNANAVVRLNEMEVIIESQKRMTIHLKRIITVLNEEGNRNVGAISGYDRYNKIKKIEAIVYDEHGDEIKKIRKKDFIDHSAVDGGTLYSDSRMLFMSYFPIKYPYTVMFNCEIETPNTAGVPSWRPIDSYFLGIEKDVYSISDQASLGLRFKEVNFDQFNIENINEGGNIKYILKNTPALKPEDLSPSLSKFSPKVLSAVDKFHFYGVDGIASNWNEFGNWINNELLADRNSVSEETKNKVLELTNGINDPIEKAKKVYQFVQDNTRYISVQVGIGGVQPIDALVVDELKYGDCKGLTNYTHALLEIAGVKSHYTVVQAGNEIVDFENDFASLEQGNHIILGIPNKEKMIWVDCTSQIHPFGFIGDFTDNRNVLVVEKDFSKIIRTEKYLNESNYQYTEAKITLNPDASISSEIIIKTRGIQYDNRFFMETEPNSEVIEFYKEFWGEINNLKIEKFVFENDKDKVEFIEKLQVDAKKYGSIAGERIIFSANVFNKNNFIPDRYRNRKMSLEIQRGYLDEDVYEIALPEGFNVESIPKNTDVKNKFGEYKVDYILSDNKLTYKRKLLILSGEFAKTEYGNYRDFRKQISKCDNSKIVLIKK